MRSYLGALALGLIGLTSASHAQSADTIFGERAYALALDDRCALFSPAQRDALDAARLQARGVLLRGGVAAYRLNHYTAQLTQDAAGQGCASELTLALRDRVIDAFSAYVRMRDMNFPGESFGWMADRQAFTADAAWVLLQDTGVVRAGLSAVGGHLAFSVSSPSQREYTSAVLVTRDPERDDELFDPTSDGVFLPPAEAEWARWTPPEHARRLVWASNHVADPMIELLFEEDDNRPLYRFPDSAIEALASLDPRETARIDYMDQQGNRVRSVYIEVGDFSAALAFLRASITAAMEAQVSQQP
jgi:hypothetical protein